LEEEGERCICPLRPSLSSQLKVSVHAHIGIPGPDMHLTFIIIDLSFKCKGYTQDGVDALSVPTEYLLYIIMTRPATKIQDLKTGVP